MWHNVVWTILFLTVPIAMGLLGAFLLSQIKHFQLFFRIAYFIPYVVASVVNCAIWQNILDPERGIGSVACVDRNSVSRRGLFLREHTPRSAIRRLRQQLGLVGLHLAFVFDRIAVRGSEKLRCGEDRRRWPLAAVLERDAAGDEATFIFVVLLTIINSLLVFDYIFIITRGGPAGASEVVGTLMWKGRSRDGFEAGYASAMGLGLSFISGVIVLIFIFLRRRGWEF